MKKIVILILSLILLSQTAVSCADNDKKDVESTTTTEQPPVTTVEMDSWATYCYNKVRGEQGSPDQKDTSADVYLAKNEAESVQLCLRSEDDITDVTFKIADGNNEHISYKIYTIRYITINRRQKLPDPMIPYEEGKNINITADETMIFYVEFTTNADTPAGEYPYVFEAYDSDGNAIVSFDISVNVWNFAYPETPTLDTAVGVWISQIVNTCGIGGEIVYKQFYDFMLEHKISAYDLPYKITDERADAYMSDPRVTSFCLRWGGDFNDNDLDAAYEKLKTNPEWMKKAYIYVLDEPSTIDNLNEMKKRCEELRAKYPELRLCVPFYVNLTLNDGSDQLDFMSEYVDLLCPKLNMWGDEVKFPNYYERLKAIQASGNKVWTYVCNYPQTPYSNLFANESGLSNRVLFWQQYGMGVDGFLYWCSNYWQNAVDPYKDIDTGMCGDPPTAYGDGLLIYPGLNYRVIYDFATRQIRPNPSVRLKIVRDGIEDFDLLTIAEELFGREWVMEQVNSISPNLTTIKADNDSFSAMRIAIGNAINDKLSER